jgi:hypothetical protein
MGLTRIGLRLHDDVDWESPEGHRVRSLLAARMHVRVNGRQLGNSFAEYQVEHMGDPSSGLIGLQTLLDMTMKGKKCTRSSYIGFISMDMSFEFIYWIGHRPPSITLINSDRDYIAGLKRESGKTHTFMLPRFSSSVRSGALKNIPGAFGISFGQRDHYFRATFNFEYYGDVHISRPPRRCKAFLLRREASAVLQIEDKDECSSHEQRRAVKDDVKHDVKDDVKHEIKHDIERDVKHDVEQDIERDIKHDEEVKDTNKALENTITEINKARSQMRKTSRAGGKLQAALVTPNVSQSTTIPEKTPYLNKRMRKLARKEELRREVLVKKAKESKEKDLDTYMKHSISYLLRK